MGFMAPGLRAGQPALPALRLGAHSTGPPALLALPARCHGGDIPRHTPPGVAPAPSLRLGSNAGAELDDGPRADRKTLLR